MAQKPEKPGGDDLRWTRPEVKSLGSGPGRLAPDGEGGYQSGNRLGEGGSVKASSQVR